MHQLECFHSSKNAMLKAIASQPSSYLIRSLIHSPKLPRTPLAPPQMLPSPSGWPRDSAYSKKTPSPSLVLLWLKNARNASKLYDNIWSLNTCWDSMIVTYRQGSKQTPQDVLLRQSCPKSIRMASSQLRTCPVQWLHLKLDFHNEIFCFNFLQQHHAWRSIEELLLEQSDYKSAFVLWKEKGEYTHVENTLNR
jgi:hypothetical protein